MLKTFVLSANLTFPRANGGGEQRDLSTFCSAFLAPTPGRPAARTLDFRICTPPVTPPPSPNSTSDPEPQCDQANHE